MAFQSNMKSQEIVLESLTTLFWSQLPGKNEASRYSWGKRQSVQVINQEISQCNRDPKATVYGLVGVAG